MAHPSTERWTTEETIVGSVPVPEVAARLVTKRTRVLDHTVPPELTRSAFKHQQKNPSPTETVELPERGHSLTIDHGWPEVAKAALDFVAAHVPA